MTPSDAFAIIYYASLATLALAGILAGLASLRETPSKGE